MRLFRESRQINKENIINDIRENALPLHSPEDLDPLMDLIGDSKYVLLGEASHGTHEYYTWRIKITQRLIQEKGFTFIAVEGDWPDCYKLNRYVKHYPNSGNSALEVLKEFNRWPTWMWANWEIVALAEWLRDYNADRSDNEKIGFYGLDVYSLRESIDAILKYLEKIDRKAFAAAKKAALCFEPYNYEGQEYAFSTYMQPYNCEEDVISMLSEIRTRMNYFPADHEAAFSTEQNAIVALHAENYYRHMIRGGSKTWNLRDSHMVETLNRLMKFHGEDAKVIVWEHNTHIGDARATDMTQNGMINVGELVSEEHRNDGVIKVGFGSYKGTVMASTGWGNNMYEMNVPEGRSNSWEELMHQAGDNDKLLLTHNLRDNLNFENPIDHRAIGVVYHPEREHMGNYVPSLIPLRYDAFIHIDETRALHPIHIKPDKHEVPETYPWGV